MSHERSDGLERRRFVADPEMLAMLGMSIDDLADSDARSFVIRSEHPEFEEALDAGIRDLDLGYGPINPRLHLAMHEIVATQLWDDDPPEVWATASRLRDAGYERHEILHMLGWSVTEQVWAAWNKDESYDRAGHVAALDSLPGSWGHERSAMSADKGQDVARKQARLNARAARRRNRRPKP